MIIFGFIRNIRWLAGIYLIPFCRSATLPFTLFTLPLVRRHAGVRKHPFLPFLLIQVFSLTQSLPLCYNHRDIYVINHPYMLAGLKLNVGDRKWKLIWRNSGHFFYFKDQKNLIIQPQCSLSAKFEHPFTGEFWNFHYKLNLVKNWNQTIHHLIPYCLEWIWSALIFKQTKISQTVKPFGKHCQRQNRPQNSFFLSK